MSVADPTRYRQNLNVDRRISAIPCLHDRLAGNISTRNSIKAFAGEGDLINSMSERLHGQLLSLPFVARSMVALQGAPRSRFPEEDDNG